MPKYLSHLLLATMTTVLASASHAVAPTVSPAAISADVKFLSADTLQGRAPGGPGERGAIDYIADQFARSGLMPAGDVEADGKLGWFQKVAMQQFDLVGPVGLELAHGTQIQHLPQGQDIAIATNAPVDHIHFKHAPLVFIGYGVTDAARRWDDYKGVDLHGKIAVVLVNDPDFETDMGGLFEGRVMTFYGRYTYKFLEAERRGALGVLVIHEPVAATIPWASTSTYFSGPRIALADRKAGAQSTLVEGWISQQLATNIFQLTGRNYANEKKKAASRTFVPYTLDGVTLSGDYGVKRTTFISHNVVAELKGTTRPDESVLYTAHWDHLGIGPPDQSGDRIYNGAQDNASGVADIIELARNFAKAPRTERSLLFIALTGEEKGLLGSQTYVEHPSLPLAKTVADLNLDALDINTPTRDISLWGHGHVSLERNLADVAQAHGRVLAVNPRFEVGYYFRADHFSFAKAGVPAITLGSGVDMLSGGRAAGEAVETDYFENRYHHPSDEWRASMNFSGQAADIALYYDLGRGLANSAEWPSFDVGSDYRAAQDALVLKRRGGYCLSQSCRRR